MRILLLLLLFTTVTQAQNVVYIDQIGSYNNIYIDQKDIASKSTNVTATGDFNTFNILQQGAGNHTLGIQNLKGNNNILNLIQTGSGSHELNIINMPGTTNSNNTITANQSGNVGANKWFSIWLNSTVGVNVSVTQDNATTPDQASMSIQCLTPPCGTWSYVKH
jgi:hypothetical protein